LTIQNSDFNIVCKNELSESVEDCTNRFEAQDSNLVFNYLKLTEFILANIKFTQPISPYLFKNSHIKNLIIIDPQNSIGFTHLKEEDVAGLNLVINQFYLNYTMNSNQPQWLDSDTLLNHMIFRHVNRVNINSAPQLSYIQENTFNKLAHLKILEINNVNMKDLLSKSRRWVKNLNYQVPYYDIDNISLNSSLSSNVFQLVIFI
jgi:hypothetical protein